MPKYLIQASYKAEGAKGLRKEGASKRRQAVESLVKEAGGNLEALYYAFGEDDVVAIVEYPDNVSAAAVSLAVNASGVTKMRVTPLLTIEEMDAATKKQIGYRGPGQ